MFEKQRKNAVASKLALLELEATQKNITLQKLANEKFEKQSNRFSCYSLFGPLLLSVAYLFFPLDPSNLIWKHIIIDVSTTMILIIFLCVSLHKVLIYQSVISNIETSKAFRLQKIQSLENEIRKLKKDQSFYVLAAQKLGEAMKEGKKDIEELAKALFAVIHFNLSQITSEDNFTLNLYELNNKKVKMIMSTTRLKHITRDTANPPVLYNVSNGLDITDPSIKDYYCIKCMSGKIQGENGKYILRYWTEIAQAFKWDRWGTLKSQIIKEKNRAKAKNIGFNYNQYVGFEIQRDDGILIFFEIIANDDVQIANCDSLDDQAYYLRETYSPLLSILWDIAS